MASMILGHALKAKAKDVSSKISSHSELPNNSHKIIKIFLYVTNGKHDVRRCLLRQMASMILGHALKAKAKDVSSKIFLALGITE